MNFIKSLSIQTVFLVIVLICELMFIYGPSIEQLKLYPEYFTFYNNHTKILLVYNDIVSESEIVDRLKIAAKNLKIELRTIWGNENIQPANKIRTKIINIIKVFKPDFILLLIDGVESYPGAPNYLLLQHDANRYLKHKENGRIVFISKYHEAFDAILPAFQDIDSLKAAYKESGKKYFGFTWYPTIYSNYPINILQQQLYKLLVMHKDFKDHANLLQEIKLLKDIDLTLMPTNIRSMLLEHKMPTHCALIQIHKQKYTYFFDGTGFPSNGIMWKNTLLPVMQTLYKTKSMNIIIPDGVYLIYLKDGLHEHYPWPILTFAADRDLVEQGKAFLIPDYEALTGYTSLFKTIDAAKETFPWQAKVAKIFWRGQVTGEAFLKDPNSLFPRLSLMHASIDKNYIDAAFTHFTNEITKHKQEYIAKKFPLKSFIPPTESLKYKYLLDVDGHSCSYSRMAWILYSNSLLMKHQSNKMQWYYDKLKPYVHYLPIAEDFSNLSDQYAWAEAHQAEVQKIIANGQKLAKEVFKPENILQSTADGFIAYHNAT